MEVEVKLRLASAKDHEKVLERFKDDIGEVHNQVRPLCAWDESQPMEAEPGRGIADASTA